MQKVFSGVRKSAYEAGDRIKDKFILCLVFLALNAVVCLATMPGISGGRGKHGV